MKFWIFCFSVCLIHSIPASAAHFFVSTDATPAGDGTASRPWTLQTALNHPTSLRPGDTVWIRAGTYLNDYDPQTSFVCKTNGTQNAPIIFRNYNNERVILDGNKTYTLYLSLGVCSHTWFWGIEVTNTFSTDRNQNIFGGVTCTAENMKFINMIIHDTGHGLDVWKTARDNEIYGCVIYHIGNNLNNNGNLEGHGHGMYLQNDTFGTRWIHNNIVFSTYGFGIRVWQTTTTAALGNFDIQKNIVFNGGAASDNNGGVGNNARTHNFFLVSNGAGNPLRNTLVKHNCTFAGTNTPRPPVNAFGLNAGLKNVTIDSNFLTCQTRLGFNNTPVFEASFKGNKVLAGIPAIYGYYLWGFLQTDFPDNEYIPQLPTSGIDFFIFPNKFDPDRNHLAIYNWANLDTVYIHSNSANLKVGETYELINAMDYHNDIIEAKVGVDGMIPIPMIGHSAQLAHASAKLPVSQFPQFGCFVLKKSNKLQTSVGETEENNKLEYIYPNPSEGFINLFNARELEEILVLNSNGQTVYQRKLDKSMHYWNLDLSFLPKGIYFAKLKKANSIKLIKFNLF
ncbi:MAG: T9SS type A sorting domain-containing protein [Saprospiraceae bacterium]|nr:T9SS type A sorting domain-containing protein [Saprospiraceae bacterium]